MSTKTKRVPAARKDAKRKPRRNDTSVIVLAVAGCVVAAGLALANRGVVGEVVADLFRMLFGIGAWLVPPILWLLAGALAFNRKLAIPRFMGGLLLIAVCILAFAARPGLGGDWFDPEVIKVGGGYLGALVAFLANKAFGGAAPVVIGAIGALGLLAATNYPFFPVLETKFTALASWWQKRSRTRKVVRNAVAGQAVVKMPRRQEPTPEAPTAPTPQERAKALVDAPPKKKVDRSTLQGVEREGYILPPLTLLHDPPAPPKPTVAEVGKKIELLERTLDEFGIKADVVEVAQGPTVTRYEITLGPGVKVQKIVSLADNLAMSLAAIGLRVEAPIPGKSAIGVEVPNDNPASIGLKEILGHKSVLDAPERLVMALGKDVGGEARYANLAKMPHLLIGGATNSGKSVGLSAMVASLLMRNTPKDVRLVLIDPKRVELTLFDGVPHLMCPVIKEVKKVASVFKALIYEMDRRYDVLSEATAKNIDSYNQKVSYNARLPYVVVVVDELADLMMQQGQEIEQSICRLAQLARAVGIHLVLATQRPSVDVITGTIKANISSRIAFAVTSAVDSRTILDSTGADRLIGRGDMLYMPIDAAKPVRIQGCYISEADIAAIVGHWQAQEDAEFLLEPVDSAESSGGTSSVEGSDDDPLYMEAVRTVIQQKTASVSMLQRRFKIGYQRAARLIDIMENRGVVGAQDGPRPREILIDPAEYREMYGDDE